MYLLTCTILVPLSFLCVIRFARRGKTVTVVNGRKSRLSHPSLRERFMQGAEYWSSWWRCYSRACKSNTKLYLQWPLRLVMVHLILKIYRFLIPDTSPWIWETFWLIDEGTRTIMAMSKLFAFEIKATIELRKLQNPKCRKVNVDRLVFSTRY